MGPQLILRLPSTGCLECIKYYPRTVFEGVVGVQTGGFFAPGSDPSVGLTWKPFAVARCRTINVHRIRKTFEQSMPVCYLSSLYTFLPAGKAFSQNIKETELHKSTLVLWYARH